MEYHGAARRNHGHRCVDHVADRRRDCLSRTPSTRSTVTLAHVPALLYRTTRPPLRGDTLPARWTENGCPARSASLACQPKPEERHIAQVRAGVGVAYRRWRPACSAGWADYDDGPSGHTGSPLFTSTSRTRPAGAARARRLLPRNPTDQRLIRAFDHGVGCPTTKVRAGSNCRNDGGKTFVGCGSQASCSWSADEGAAVPAPNSSKTAGRRRSNGERQMLDRT